MYELMAIMKPLLPDDVRKAIHKNIVKMITDMGGSVKDVDVWGKRYLAYKIKGHAEGYYILYSFELPSLKVEELKRQLSLKPEIIRSMVIKLDKSAEIGKNLKKKQIELDDDSVLVEKKIEDAVEQVSEKTESVDSSDKVSE